MSNFSERPFVAGSLVGLRSFAVDELGRLTGPSYGGVFLPGVNEGRCEPLGRTQHWVFRQLFGASGLVRAVPAAPDPAPAGHRAGSMGCSCGYYAYFDGSNEYARPDRVTAIVEGTGVCTVGSRGFRAEKARLLALVDESSGRRTHPVWYDRLADWCYRTKAAATVGLLGLAAGCAGVAAAVSLVTAGHAAGALLLPLALLLGVGWLALCWYADSHGIDRAHPTVSDVSRCHDAGSRPVPWDLVERNYPDVPIYRSLAAALRDFPLTVPPDPTPDDPDFWTQRVAS